MDVKYSNFKKNLGNLYFKLQIISWILILKPLNNGTFDFKKNLFENIISQCNHLKKNIRFEKNPLKRVEALTALILSGITFKDYEENYNIGVKELEKFVKNNYDDDGFPLTRSPNDLIYFTKYLLLCRIGLMPLVLQLF